MVVRKMHLSSLTITDVPEELLARLHITLLKAGYHLSSKQADVLEYRTLSLILFQSK